MKQQRPQLATGLLQNGKGEEAQKEGFMQPKGAGGPLWISFTTAKHERLQMHLKAERTFYVKLIFGTFWFGLSTSLWTVFLAIWEANDTLSFGYRKVGSAALNRTANQQQGQKPSGECWLHVLCSWPTAAKGIFHLARHRRWRKQEKSKIEKSGKKIAERKTLHTSPKGCHTGTALLGQARGDKWSLEQHQWRKETKLLNDWTWPSMPTNLWLVVAETCLFLLYPRPFLGGRGGGGRKESKTGHSSALGKRNVSSTWLPEMEELWRFAFSYKDHVDKLSSHSRSADANASHCQWHPTTMYCFFPLTEIRMWRIMK